MKIRPIQVEEESSARELILHGLGEHFGEIDREINRDLHSITSTYAPPSNHFLVALDSANIIVGTGCLVQDGTTGHIVRMSTSAARRREGIATSILSELIAEAERRRLKRVVTATEPHWNDAVGLYTSFGFRQFDRDDVDVHLEYLLETDKEENHASGEG